MMRTLRSAMHTCMYARYSEDAHSSGQLRALKHVNVFSYVLAHGIATPYPFLGHDAIHTLACMMNDAYCMVQEKKKEMAQNATLAVTGAVGWRREGIRYKKNEVYLDIIETVNLLMSSNGE